MVGTPLHQHLRSRRNDATGEELRSGYFPLAYVYPKEKRNTRDLLRRRSAFVRQRAQLITHIQLLNSQYNLPAFEKKLTYKGNRTAAIADRFGHPSTQLSVAANLNLIDSYDQQIAALELHLTRSAKIDDPATFAFLKSIPGIGPILGLVMLYEIDAIARFPEVKNFLSYSRLVLGTHESAGKVKGFAGRKLGNAHLKWAFSEAASLMLRSFAPAKSWMQRSRRRSAASRRRTPSSKRRSAARCITCGVSRRRLMRRSSWRVEGEPSWRAGGVSPLMRPQSGWRPIRGLTPPARPDAPNVPVPMTAGCHCPGSKPKPPRRDD